MDSDLDRIAERLRGSVIALDFDGTLSPIVADPTRSRPVPGVVDSLTGLARAGAQVAIVTGRDALTVLELGRLQTIDSLIVSGLHGAERWQDGELVTREEPAGIAALRDTLPAVLGHVDSGVRLEDKRLSLVVHTRRAADPTGALSQLGPVVTELAAACGLEVHPGKLVLEIRIPDLSKADAVRALLTDGTTAALFAGDDLGDLPAVHALRRWAHESGRPGISVAVGEVAELSAVTDFSVSSPFELATLLAGLLRTAR